MYKINRKSNSISPLEKKSFSELGFRESEHLQEWIAKLPDVFGEELLIIQKEFSGFTGTRERLDLLALDQEGALVIIENKLDDSGKDVTWQGLKYASYCSRLTKSDITHIYQRYLDATEPGADAAVRISDFMHGREFEEVVLTPRIILVAAKFRIEVTSTVLWLIQQKVRLQCFEVVPYAQGEELFLKIEQIIPMRDAEPMMVGMARKEQDDADAQAKRKKSRTVNREFWTRLIQAMNGTQSALYQNVSPKGDNWITAGSEVEGIGFHFSANTRFARAELYIGCDSKEENKFIFDQLLSQKDKIETAFGGPLGWEPVFRSKDCMIKAERPYNLSEREQWPTMIEFMTDAMCLLEAAVREPLKEIGEQLKRRRDINS